MPEPSSFSQALASDRFIILCELDPPHSADPSLKDDKIAFLKGKIQAAVVPDNHQAKLHMSPLAFSRYLLDQGVEPMMTLTCRDRNRLALQSDLLGAAALGISNILALTGDYLSWGDHPQAKPVFDLDSIQLLQAISQFKAGTNLMGKPLEGRLPQFTVGALVPLKTDPLGPQILKFRKKMAVGVDFFMSHPLFDLEGIGEFLSVVSETGKPLLATIRLFKPRDFTGPLKGRLPGLVIPPPVLEQFGALQEEEMLSRSLEMAAGVIQAVKKDGRFRGIHLLLRGAEERIGELL
jgi:5,10-methylenetetrahydrofolate reductase